MNIYAILNDDNEVVHIDDVAEWAKALESRWYTDEEGIQRDRFRVKSTTMEDGRYVSTVFLGMDMSFGADKPEYFETMVFPQQGDYSDIYMSRCGTWEEAVIQHKTVIKAIIDGDLTLNKTTGELDDTK